MVQTDNVSNQLQENFSWTLVMQHYTSKHAENEDDSHVPRACVNRSPGASQWLFDQEGDNESVNKGVISGAALAFGIFPR